MTKIYIPAAITLVFAFMLLGCPTSNLGKKKHDVMLCAELTRLLHRQNSRGPNYISIDVYQVREIVKIHKNGAEAQKPPSRCASKAVVAFQLRFQCIPISFKQLSLLHKRPMSVGEKPPGFPPSSASFPKKIQQKIYRQV